MVNDDAEAYKYASEELRHDRDFALQVVKRNGKALKFVLPKFQADPQVVQAAVTKDPTAAVHAHASRRAEMGFIDNKLHGEAQLRQELEAQTQAAVEAGESDQLALCSQHLVQGPNDQGVMYTTMKLQKTVLFTAMSSFFGNMGQSNYTAANAVMDKIPGFERPEIDAVGLMWGAVGHIGMRFKAFASMDALNATPEALLTIEDSRMVLQLACCCMDTPEWFNANHFDEFSRSQVLQPTAGQIKYPDMQSSAAETTGHWDDMVAKDKMALESAVNVDRRPLPGNAGFIEAESAPLGGWPSLLGAGAVAASDMPLTPGARVQLTGLKAKNGVTGVLVQMAGDGKWKVKLDDGSGIALLRSSFLQAIGGGQIYPEEVTGTENQYQGHLEKYDSAEAEIRRAKIASRRAELKEKLAMRRQAQM